MNIIEEMEQHILKNSVFQIFDLMNRVRHKIIKISHESSMLELWETMINNKLKMVALESVPDPENKIPSFIQGFITYADFLEFFLDHFEGTITPFETKMKDLDFYYAKSRVNEGEE